MKARRQAKIKCAAPVATQRGQSIYVKYPMPFFNAAKRDTWDAKPTGDYGKDCNTGRAFAMQFLQSCDGTDEWRYAFCVIIHEMIRKGPQGEPLKKGGTKTSSGVVVGFLGTIGEVVTIAMRPDTTLRVKPVETQPNQIVALNDKALAAFGNLG